MKTFYLASSSKHREATAKRGMLLYEYGLRWFNDWNWPRFELALFDDALMGGCVSAGDISAAVGCDVFILYVEPDDPKSMSWAELGARISHHKEAHVITNGYENAFWTHPCVKVHATWMAFLEWLIQDYGLAYRPRVSDRLPKQ